MMRAWQTPRYRLLPNRYLSENSQIAHPDRFRRLSIEGERDLSAYGWAVDTPDDFDFVAQIFEALHQDGRIFGLEEVLELLEQQKAPVL